MGKAKDWIDKIKYYFKGDDSPINEKPYIQIRERHESTPQTTTPSMDIAPKIKIIRTNNHVPTASGGNVEGNQVGVLNPNLGHGMRVINQRKPRRCPICATQGRVVANSGASGRWRCEECGSTF